MSPRRSVLVPLANPATARQLVQLGARLARRIDGGLTLLHAEVDEAERGGGRDVLEAAGAEAEESGVSVERLTPVAPTVAEAIIRATQEPHVEYLVMGWRGHLPDGASTIGSNIDAVVRESRCHTVVMQEGALRTDEQVLVPVANPNAAPLALAVASLLCAEQALAVTVLHLSPLALSDREKEAFRSALFGRPGTGGQNLRALPDAAAWVDLIFEVQEDPARELALHSGYYDRMILGTSRGGYTAEPVFATFQLDIAREARCPVVFVRPKEKGARFSF